MADYPFLLGAAFRDQVTLGTPVASPNPGSGSGAGGAIDTSATDGAVLGDPSAGVNETGIDFTLGRNFTDKSPLTGSYTRDVSNYVATTIETFSISVPMKGNGNAASTPPVATDFPLDPGLVSLFRAAGLVGSANAAQWQYLPDEAAIISGAVYMADASGTGIRVQAKDLLAASLAMSFTPGETAVAAFELAGNYHSRDSAPWGDPKFDYGNQATLSAPAVKAVNFIWGPGTPVARAIGFSELTITLDNSIDEIPSSNAESGTLDRQSDRTVTITGTIDAEDSDLLYEIDQLAASQSSALDTLSFQVGTQAASGEIAEAFIINVPYPELTNLQANELGGSQAYTVEMIARGVTADSEFSISFA